jgi:hypothetical protein
MMSLSFFLLCFSSLLLLSSASYDWSMGNTSVWLSAAAYCEVNTLLTRTYRGYSTGFKALYTIEEKTYDTQGYAGVMESEQTIFVIFRGSTSMTDWINNIDDILTPYSYCTGCDVHLGWYKVSNVYNYNQ